MIAPDLAIALAIALALLFGTAWLAVAAAERRRRGMRDRLAAIAAAAQPVASVDEPVSVRKVTDSEKRGLRLPPAVRARIEVALAATGDRLTSRHLVVAGLLSGATASAFAIGIFALPVWATLPLALAAALCGPILLVRWAQHRFQRQFLAVFSDALDLMVRAVRAGLPVLEAITAAGQETADPVGREFRRLIDEMRVGVEMEEVLQRAADRIRINDFRFLAVTLILQKRTGGGIGETLANLTNVIRRRKELRLKARAVSSEARGSATFLAALPMVMGGITFLLNPDYMSVLFVDQRGRAILGAALASLVIGFWLMSFMIKRTVR